MPKKIFLSCTTCAFLLAGENVEIVSTDMYYTDANKTIEAKGDALALSQGSFLRADRILYHKEEGFVEAFGDIYLTRPDNSYAIADYAKITPSTKKGEFSHLFYFDKVSGMWFSGVEGNSSETTYTFQDGIASGCNPNTPTWTLRFSKATYYKDINFVTMVNPKLYAKDEVPLFYLPFFAFPTDKSRHSGLLPPRFGYVKDEGLVYQQPIYLAFQKWWDVELSPQIRTDRGSGINTTFRFADSAFSKGRIDAGWFKDDVSFNRRKLIEQPDSIEFTHQTHIGLKAHYERSHLLDDNDAKDFLYFDGIWFNDIGYLNLEKSDTRIESDSLITSRLNYMYEKELYYAGFYARYFLDAHTDDHSTTIQTLPTLHLHRYSDSALNGIFLYSLDAKMKNWTRENGVTARQSELSIPLTLQTSLGDDYAHLSLTEIGYINNVTFDNASTKYDTYRRYSTIHKAELSSELMHPYETFLHSLHFNFSYSAPGLNNATSQQKPIDFAKITTSEKVQKMWSIGVSQFFYDTNGSLFLKHRLTQNYLPGTSGESLSELENEVVWTPGKWNISNILRYNYDRNLISSSTSTLSYSQDNLHSSLSHIYKDEHNTIDTNYYNATISYQLNGIHSIGADYQYDAIAHETRARGIWFTSKRRCFEWSVKYREENTLGSITMNRAIYVQLNLIPLVKFDQKYILGNQ